MKLPARVDAGFVDRAHEPTDLGRQRELVARLLAQHAPEADLRLTEPVQRGDIEVADADVPGVLDDRLGRRRRGPRE